MNFTLKNKILSVLHRLAIWFPKNPEKLAFLSPSHIWENWSSEVQAQCPAGSLAEGHQDAGICSFFQWQNASKSNVPSLPVIPLLSWAEEHLPTYTTVTLAQTLPITTLSKHVLNDWEIRRMTCFLIQLASAKRLLDVVVFTRPWGQGRLGIRAGDSPSHAEQLCCWGPRTTGSSYQSSSTNMESGSEKWPSIYIINRIHFSLIQ